MKTETELIEVCRDIGAIATSISSIEQRLEKIEVMLTQLTAVLSVSVPSHAPLTVAQRAIQMAKSGLVEESKELLRAHSKRRSA